MKDADELVAEPIVGQQRDDGRAQRLYLSPTSATNASISPSMSWVNASMSGSSPCSRSVPVVTGPMLTIRGRRCDPARTPSRSSNAARKFVTVEEAVKVEIVGTGDRREAFGIERLDDRLIDRHHVDLRTPLPESVREHIARAGRASDQGAVDRRRGQRVHQPLGNRSIRHDVGTYTVSG